MTAIPAPGLQQASQGLSGPDLKDAALFAAEPADELSWLDIGCGRGDLIRLILDRWRPASVVGCDIIDWLAEDLRGRVEVITGSAESTVDELPTAERVLMVEVLEHLEAPWTVLRLVARRVRPGGRLVVTTPNVTSLRHRLELVVRGQLTSFRPDNEPHLTPVLPHVVERILGEEGLAVTIRYTGVDLIPLTGGRRWPQPFVRRYPNLTSRSVLLVAERAAAAAGNDPHEDR